MLYKAQEEDLLDRHITWAEDEKTDMAKQDTTSHTKPAIDVAHQPTDKKPTPIIQRGYNLGLSLGANLQRIQKDQARPTACHLFQ